MTTIITTTMNDSPKQRVTLFVRHAIVKHARAQAVVEDITLTTLIERALLKYLPKETVIRKSDD